MLLFHSGADTAHRYQDPPVKITAFVPPPPGDAIAQNGAARFMALHDGYSRDIPQNRPGRLLPSAWHHGHGAVAYCSRAASFSSIPRPGASGIATIPSVATIRCLVSESRSVVPSSLTNSMRN